MQTLSIDIETYSDVNLSKCGVYKYTESPDFEILLFGYSADGSDVTVNPMRYVKYPKVERKPRERIILTLEEWQQIIDRFPAGTRFHIPLMIGFYTGLRISKALALTWDDIDLEKRTITVSKQIVKRNFRADVRKVGKTEGEAGNAFFMVFHHN